MSNKCEQCGDNYERITMHWSYSPDCSYPPLSKHQIEVATGLLMGDGWINRGGKNPFLSAEMVSPDYLKYIDSIFGVFGNGLKLRRTAEESAQHMRECGLNEDAKSENYSNTYQWNSSTHPELKELSGWYSDDGKVWPENIEMTPTVLKHWYCCDGHWETYGTSNRISFGMSNESGNKEKINKIFSSVGLPSPNNYVEYERENNEETMEARFTVSQSEDLWEYMGSSLPDFEYKWPEKYR